MTRIPEVPPAAHRLIEFLGELGPRWGLPADPCRIHGYLYLVARPVPEAELERAVKRGGSLHDALLWLRDYNLVESAGSARWQTSSDPWELVMRALNERRSREVKPALDLLRQCHAELLTQPGSDTTMRAQAGKLIALVEDLAAIDSQAQRLSPRALRQMVGLGGFAARLLDRTLGGRRSGV